jgi:predicted helicase
MPEKTAIKPTSKAIREYRETLDNYGAQGVSHETAVRSAFQGLLATTAQARGWMLVPELSTHALGKHSVRPDGTVRDANGLPRGYWEAKDTADDLDAEIAKKKAKGYPTSNIIFEDTRTAVLLQDGAETMRADLGKVQEVADLLNLFFGHNEPHIEDFEQAVEEFKERVPELARGLAAKIDEAHKTNSKFQAAFADFFNLCRGSLNPAMNEAAVDEMLAQHLLTERLICNIFNNPDFVRRNVIAAEVEKVIDALVSKSFNRQKFLKSLDRFYVAIEGAATGLADFGEKQQFLNTVYERFFQGYSVKTADTHGIIYTPQPIANFMCASVEEVLKQEFGKSLGDPDVLVLDPCTGTGNFVVNLLRRAPKPALERFYKKCLFANEIMLLPYYIAALNIEHAYYELAGQYEPFEGLCFVDTLELAEHEQAQLGIFAEKNTARVARQRSAPITVIIGNPPYNVGQKSENENNKNRSYPVIEKRIKDTYVKDSKATLKTQLYDAYVKFFRWAVDRLEGRDGIVCFVSNNSFVDQMTFDGMRKHLLQDFTQIYHVDLHGNVRKNPKLSGTTHNVFGIQVGVGITVAVRAKKHKKRSLLYHRVPEGWRKEEKYDWLNTTATAGKVKWEGLAPDEKHTWLVPENAGKFAKFIPVGSREAKATTADNSEVLCRSYGRGVMTCRDDVVYDFQEGVLLARMEKFVENYNAEVDRFSHAKGPLNIDDFVRTDHIKWDGTLKGHLKDQKYGEFTESAVRVSLYRPFTKRPFYFDRLFLNSIYLQPYFFPTAASEQENRVIALTDVGSEKPFMALVARSIVDLHIVGAGATSQCFPFYVYDADGTNRRENITDWALSKFRARYDDKKLDKWDIFHYVYGVLHHPTYREKFADCLKRELPRIPLTPPSPAGRGSKRSSLSRRERGQKKFPLPLGEGKGEGGFHAFRDAGRALAALHLDYEKLEPFKLNFVATPDKPLSYLVEDKMRLAKDRKSLAVNPTLALAGIPKEAFDYRLGNRSALEWVIDQYQVSEDKASGVRSDPNRPDDPEYIVRLVGQVIRVSVETAKTVNALPPLGA